MEIGETFFFQDRVGFRKWLETNYDKKKELWLIFYKKQVKKKGLQYEEAVEEALCYGWIDGILKRLDDEKHVIRYSPRRKKSVWSQHNIDRVRKLLKQGKIKEPGISVLPEVGMRIYGRDFKNTRLLKIDRSFYEVDDHIKTYRFFGRNPEWRKLSRQENQANKIHINGYTRIFTDGRTKVFEYKRLR